jgi:hypothetical protein
VSDSQLSFVEQREVVEEMLDAGMPFWAVEAAVDRADLPADERDALWLVAWTLNDLAPARALAGVD